MHNFIFFQNCISPHQMPYIEALSKRDDVENLWVIAPRLAYDDRAAMGWPTSWTQSSDKLGILINPNDSDIENLLKENPICLFSGITAFSEIKHWLDLSLAYNVKRGIITEGPFVYKKPLWIHKLRFLIKDLRYVKHFDYVFAIGEDCEKYYRGWSKRWKVVPFMYCTEFNEAPVQSELPDTSELKVCFVGNLEPRKDVATLIKANGLIKDNPPKLTIVGDGKERKRLEEFVQDKPYNVCFVGAKPMNKVQEIIFQNDVLVLPSRHDGWGAVINEAMILGTLPVCSNKCGAKILIKKSGFGRVFRAKDEKELSEILKELSNKKDSLRTQRAERINWAKQYISPVSVAERFIIAISQ